jgi:GTP-binding protein
MHVTTLDLRRLPRLRGHRPGRVGPHEAGRARPVRSPRRQREEFRVAKILGFQSLKRFELAEAAAGDICAITGMQDLTVGETITEIERPVVLPLLEIEEPTVKMYFMANNGPFAGTEGKYVTSRNLRDRLFKETKSNVALRVNDTESPDTFEVLGRGELHLTVLIETMRREGYELMVSQPQVIFKTEGGRRAPGALRGGGHRSRRGLLGPGHRGAGPARGSHAGDGARRRGPHAPRVPVPGARPHRLPVAVPDRHARHRLLNHNFKHYGPYAGPSSGRARTAC